MTDENRFAGLGEQLTGEAGSRDPGVDESATEPTSSGVDAGADADEESDGPAFAFDETVQKSIYVRAETLDVLDDTEFEVEGLLRREHEIRDLTGREVDDAIIRLASRYPAELAELIADERE